MKKTPDNSIKLFVTHRSIGQIINQSKFGTVRVVLNWEILEPNPQIELEMLNTMKYYLAGLKKLIKSFKRTCCRVESDF